MADKKKRQLRDVVTLDQWIEVTACNGETVTEKYPSNAELREKLAHMKPPPDLIYRRIHFRGGVPEEYDWVQPDDRQRELGGICIQRLTVDGWKKLVSSERWEGGHLRRSLDPRPRPKVRGECDCETCVGNRRRLERKGIDAL
jgi:hypothetical protein